MSSPPAAVARLLDAAFGHPRGVLGRLGGSLMASGNREQEMAAVARAGLQPGDAVLVVGPGPGVGLLLAAQAVNPDGHVTGVDPSPLMRRLATQRCRHLIAAGVIDVRDGSAERTGCPDGSQDAVISVNNVMLWDRPAGFAELARVLRPGGRLVISVHRHVLDITPEQLRDQARAGGFTDLQLSVQPRRRNSPAVDLTARTHPR